MLLSGFLFVSAIFGVDAAYPVMPATPACPNPELFEYDYACVCTSTSCGEYPSPTPPSSSEALLFTSS